MSLLIVVAALAFVVGCTLAYTHGYYIWRWTWTAWGGPGSPILIRPGVEIERCQKCDGHKLPEEDPAVEVRRRIQTLALGCRDHLAAMGLDKPVEQASLDDLARRDAACRAFLRAALLRAEKFDGPDSLIVSELRRVCRTLDVPGYGYDVLLKIAWPPVAVRLDD